MHAARVLSTPAAANTAPRALHVLFPEQYEESRRAIIRDFSSIGLSGIVAALALRTAAFLLTGQ